MSNHQMRSKAACLLLPSTNLQPPLRYLCAGFWILPCAAQYMHKQPCYKIALKIQSLDVCGTAKIMVCVPSGAESEPGGSWGANLCIGHPKLWWHHRNSEQGCGWVQLFQIYLVAVSGRWWKPKRCAKAGHEALRLHHHFQAGSNGMKSASLLPCHHLCHIILQRSTPRSWKGFLLKCINLISLSCQHSNWDLMYLPLLLSPSLPLPF